MEKSDVIDALAALAQVSRLRVFRALVVAGPLGLIEVFGPFSSHAGLCGRAIRRRLDWLAHSQGLHPRLQEPLHHD